MLLGNPPGFCSCQTASDKPIFNNHLSFIHRIESINDLDQNVKVQTISSKTPGRRLVPMAARVMLNLAISQLAT